MAWVFLGALAVSGAAWLTKRALTKYVNSPSGARFWRNVQQNYSNNWHHGGITNNTKMDVNEALHILGLEQQQKLTEQSIKEAHKKLLMANHPDRGGSSYLAAKINQARDVLMKNK